MNFEWKKNIAMALKAEILEESIAAQVNAPPKPLSMMEHQERSNAEFNQFLLDIKQQQQSKEES